MFVKDINILQNKLLINMLCRSRHEIEWKKYEEASI